VGEGGGGPLCNLFSNESYSVVVLLNFFTDVIYECLYYPRVFVLGKPFQPSMMFASKVGANPSEAPSYSNI
jgi:hypothetical protein